MDSDIFELLKQSLAGEKYSIDKYISQADVSFHTEGRYITGHLYYLPFDDNTGKPDLASFSNYIMNKLIAFCIPPSQQDAIRATQESDNDSVMELTRAASETLKSIKERKDKVRSSSGEIGELILFILLEAVLGAPVVATKPFLKMNGQDQVKGCDGVHVQHDGNQLIIYYGESKLSPSVSYCITESAKSILDYHKGGGVKKTRDLSVISQNIDLKLNSPRKHELEEELKKYLNPIFRQRKMRTYKEVNACFLGFNHQIYSEISNNPKELRNKLLKDSCEKLFPELYEKIKAKIDKEIQNYNFHYFIIPFSDVEEIQTHCENYIKRFSFHSEGANKNAG